MTHHSYYVHACFYHKRVSFSFGQLALSPIPLLIVCANIFGETRLKLLLGPEPKLMWQQSSPVKIYHDHVTIYGMYRNM